MWIFLFVITNKKEKNISIMDISEENSSKQLPSQKVLTSKPVGHHEGVKVKESPFHAAASNLQV